jgi:hypothetical protein
MSESPRQFTMIATFMALHAGWFVSALAALAGALVFGNRLRRTGRLRWALVSVSLALLALLSTLPLFLGASRFAEEYRLAQIVHIDLLTADAGFPATYFIAQLVSTSAITR